jgi:hypothetical protein
MDGRVNRCERSFTRRDVDQAKAADRLEPKGTWLVQGLSSALPWTSQPPASRADLPHPVSYVEHGKPVILPPRVGTCKGSQWDGG